MSGRILDALFRAELKTFLSNVGEQPVPESQDLRAGVLGFIATFAPEALSDTSTRLLSETLEHLHASPSYSTFEWFRLPYLDVARANLFDDPKALDVVVNNLGHGSRLLRLYLFAPVGLAIRKLNLNECGFDVSMQRNFEIGHLGNEAGVCLLLASRLTNSEKHAMLETWLERAVNEEDQLTLRQALKGAPIDNALIFSDYFSISLKLFSAILSLPSARGTVDSDLSSLFSIEPDEIVKRVRAHPLCVPKIKMV